WVASDDRMGRNVSGYYGTSPDDRALANRHAGENAGVETDPRVVADIDRAATVGTLARPRRRWARERSARGATRDDARQESVGVHDHRVPGDHRVRTDPHFTVADDEG